MKRIICILFLTILVATLFISCTDDADDTSSIESQEISVTSENSIISDESVLDESDDVSSEAISEESIEQSEEPSISPTEGRNEMNKPTIDLSYRARNYLITELQGEFNKTKIEKGYLTLDGATNGTFITDEIDVGSFSNILLSWNGFTNGGVTETFVSYMKADGSYSRWYSFGKWSTSTNVARSVDASDADAKMDIDTLKIKSDNGVAQGKIKIKISLTAKKSGSPILWNISVTTDGTSLKTIDTSKLPEEVVLDVPVRSQMVVPGIGNRICSPTSTSMVLEYLGINYDTKAVADGCLDNNDNIYGNWLFNIAFAGEQGIHAYFDMYDLDATMYALANGTPVICSIRSTDGQITNAPQGYPSGHLLVAVGYKYIDGELYLVINDPAVRELSEVRREYKASEFVTAWKMGAVYILQKD